MKQAIFSILLVGVLVSPAWSECAWVLWHEHEYSAAYFNADNSLKSNDYRHWWETPTAYSAKSECEAAQARVFDLIRHEYQEMADSGPNKGKVKVTTVPNRLAIFSRAEDHYSSTQKLT